jgi:hypothetical protein
MNPATSVAWCQFGEAAMWLNHALFECLHIVPVDLMNGFHKLSLQQQ